MWEVVLENLCGIINLKFKSQTEAELAVEVFTTSIPFYGDRRYVRIYGPDGKLLQHEECC